MADHDLTCRCIRCREIRGQETVDLAQAHLETVTYDTDATREHFLQYLTPSGHLAGFLRLSLPKAPRDEILIPEIRRAAMIREVHVYGPAQLLGRQGRGMQHRGLGTHLLEEAARLSVEAGFEELAVIAAVGTRPTIGSAALPKGCSIPSGR
jgi:elongator complex protein 3